MIQHAKQTELSRSIATWIKRVISPARLSGVNLFEEVEQLQEMQF